MGHGNSHLSRVRRTSRPAPGNDPGGAAQHRLSHLFATNMGGSHGSRATGCSRRRGSRSTRTSKVPTSTGKRCWLGASTRCWRRLVRPKRSGTLARLCLPFASSIGCAGWVLIPNVGTASTGAPTEFLHFPHAEFATSPDCSTGEISSGG